MNKYTSVFKKAVSASLVFSILGTLLYVYPLKQANAADAGLTYMRCDRMAGGIAPGSCLVVFTTSATAFSEAYIKITLDSEWVSATHFSATAGNYTVSTASLPGGVTAMPGVATADNVTGQTIRFPITALANSTTYGFFITGTGLIQNPAASTTIVHTVFSRDSGDTTTGDTKLIAVPTISNDQILITATVPPSFTFVFGNNSQALGTLSSAAVNSGSGTGITITTNAANGWYAWAKSANIGLTSTSAGSYNIATSGTINGSSSTISSGTDGYLLDVDLTTDAASGGTVAIAGEYDGGSTSAGGTVSTSYQQIASANGVANGDVITLIPRVTISGMTPAASDYTDTLTVVGAGAF